MEIPAGSRVCPRCGGKGTTQHPLTGRDIPCHRCHGWQFVAERRPRPPPDDQHLIAMHCGHRDFKEVLMLLPVREPVEDWENV